MKISGELMIIILLVILREKDGRNLDPNYTIAFVLFYFIFLQNLCKSLVVPIDYQLQTLLTKPVAMYGIV